MSKWGVIDAMAKSGAPEDVCKKAEAAVDAALAQPTGKYSLGDRYTVVPSSIMRKDPRPYVMITDNTTGRTVQCEITAWYTVSRVLYKLYVEGAEVDAAVQALLEGPEAPQE